MLKVENLSVSYGAHRALENVSIHVDKGEICVILGANGAGKTTLLKVIGGIVQPQSGAHISVDGQEIAGEKPNKIVERGIALVPEGRGIFGDLTVMENLELGAYGKQARKYKEDKLRQVLQLFPKLAERGSQIARTMSGGEQQMVAIGRALMSNPSILMLDEPSLGLSPLLSTELFKSLKQVRDTGVGILLVEQNAKQSLAIADRAYLMENSHITGQGRADIMANDPAVQKAYLGGAADKHAHRRLGEPEFKYDTQVRSPISEHAKAAQLAQRAAKIQKAHVETLRHGKMNGNATHVAVSEIKGEELIIMSSQAEDLSKKAAELASRASEVQTAFIIAQREAQLGKEKTGAPALAADKKSKPEKDKKSKKNKKSKKKKSKKKSGK